MPRCTWQIRELDEGGWSVVGGSLEPGKSSERQIDMREGEGKGQQIGGEGGMPETCGRRRRRNGSAMLDVG